ncbi:MAG: nitrite/sulfite reductase [SAR324 cluster bacterium]|nr:nitrite/sulfite reductase [SAR324 cluster bacterium]
MQTQVTSTQEWQNVAQFHNIQQTIDLYETELNRWLKGDVPELIFTEFRLRYGVYGQRQSGVQMIRIKLPLGMVSVRQLETLADLSEEIADGVSHVTTRQDIQYHNVDIRNTPEMMRRLAEVGITTREACGNVVRNVCACPKTGACATESFDVTPDALAMADFLLEHPEAQDFSRKFKIAYSGCAGEMCGLARMHDMGAIAKIKMVDGIPVKGFEMYIGGGLGAVPRQGRLLYDFIPRNEIFAVIQAIARVFTRHGERKNRNKARFKFVVDKFGIEETFKMIEVERSKLPKADSFRDTVLSRYAEYSEAPLKAPSTLDLDSQSAEFKRWYKANVEHQKETGYSVVHVFLPLGDIGATSLRSLADISRKYIKDSIRFSVEQNLLFRWVADGDLPALFADLKQLGYHGLANTLGDITSCPGSESCKLGIAASRGLASVLNDKFQNEMSDLAESKDMKIKISGCPNSCGQHHIADLGFFGSAQSKQGKTAPVFQMILGGTTTENAKSYGLAVGKISPHNIPEAIQRIEQLFKNERQQDEVFSGFMQRVGKQRVKQELEDLMSLPSFEEHPEFFTDSRRTREFKVVTGQGECAGEMVPRTEFLLEECDRQNAQATLCLESGRFQDAFDLSTSAMEKSAKALLLTQGFEEFGDYSTVEKFREKFVSTSIFFIKYAEYFFSSVDGSTVVVNEENARFRVEHSTLFVEEANVVYSRIAQKAQ